MSTEHFWTDTEGAEQNCKQKCLSQSHLAHHTSRMDWLRPRITTHSWPVQF